MKIMNNDTPTVWLYLYQKDRYVHAYLKADKRLPQGYLMELKDAWAMLRSTMTARTMTKGLIWRSDEITRFVTGAIGPFITNTSSAIEQVQSKKGTLKYRIRRTVDMPEFEAEA